MYIFWVIKKDNLTYISLYYPYFIVLILFFGIYIREYND